MCFYRYYYFLGCRHQQTVLYDFCDDAEPLLNTPRDLSPPNEADSDDEGASQHGDGKVGVWTEESMACMQNIDDLLSTPSTAFNLSSHQRTPPSDIGSRSIIAEPGIDYAYSQPAAHPVHHTSAAFEEESHDMAGLPLPLFGLRQWRIGSSAAPAPQNASDWDRAPGTTNAHTRQPGIRANTDESCDLPKSNDILQHIAEFHRKSNQQSRHVQDHRIPSYGVINTALVSAAELENSQQAYDNIEAEIDSLKEDVWRLRQEADKSRPTPKTDYDLEMDKFLSTRSKKAYAADAVNESAAARLQRLHEVQSELAVQPASQTVGSMLPSQLDFPSLAKSTSSSATPSNGTKPSAHKVSYAPAASSGKIDAINQTFAAPAHKSVSNSKTLDSISTGPSPSHSIVGSLDHARTVISSTEPPRDTRDLKEDEETVIMLEDPSIPNFSPSERSSPKKGHDVSPSNKLTGVPHFAQPTKSFARRAGETVRKDSVASSSPKSPRDGSASNTVKRGDIAPSTANRTAYQQQKRKSLPGEWTQAPEKPAELKHRQIPTMIPIAKKSVKAKHTHSAPPRRQENAYMAPTAAALQRSIDTLESYKTQLEQVKRANDVLCDVVNPTSHSSAALAPETAASETSSVCFITDRTNGWESAVDDVRLTKPPPPTPEISKSATTSVVSNEDATLVPSWQIQTRSRYLSAVSERPHVVSGVYNTTKKRRTSHSDLLAPIVARLEAQGLLKSEGSNTGPIINSSAKVTPQASGSGPQSAFNPGQVSPARHSETGSDGSSVMAGAPAWKVMPPHMRRLHGATPGPGFSTTSHPEGGLPQPISQGTSFQHAFAENCRRDSVINGTAGPLYRSFTATPPMLSAPSLRATAAVFEPRKTPPEHIAVDEGNLPTGYVPDKLWDQLIPAVKDRILNSRAARNIRPWYTLPSNRMHYSDVSPTCENLFINHHASLPGVQQNQPTGGQSAVASTVQAGQILTPTLSPGKKSVHWILKDTDGKETPVKFGRAPPPSAMPFRGPSTPSMSSMSSTSSPPKTPSSTQGWHIGSTYAPQPYAWKGGDGKEISFVGYGPHAERDPNSVVGFDFHGKMLKYSAGLSNGFCEDGENEAPLPFVAPRSQRQWAEKLGYAKVPCGNVEVTHAVEAMPFGSQLAGYCYDCAGR